MFLYLAGTGERDDRRNIVRAKLLGMLLVIGCTSTINVLLPGICKAMNCTSSDLYLFLLCNVSIQQKEKYDNGDMLLLIIKNAIVILCMNGLTQTFVENLKTHVRINLAMICAGKEV